jgi:hypothetical protein
MRGVGNRHVDGRPTKMMDERMSRTVRIDDPDVGQVRETFAAKTIECVQESLGIHDSFFGVAVVRIGDGDEKVGFTGVLAQHGTDLASAGTAIQAVAETVARNYGAPVVPLLRAVLTMVEASERGERP